jgi:hypothetical protein
MRAKLRPEPRPGGRIKKPRKPTAPDIGDEVSRQAVETAAAAIDPNDWRPARPTKARLMAGR